jgi:hypothetical protein
MGNRNEIPLPKGEGGAERRVGVKAMLLPSPDSPFGRVIFP